MCPCCPSTNRPKREAPLRFCRKTTAGTRRARWHCPPLMRAPLLALFLLAAQAASARSITVATEADLRSAIARAAAGDVITARPGEYVLREPLRVRATGTADAPIVIRCEPPGAAVLKGRQTVSIH